MESVEATDWDGKPALAIDEVTDENLKAVALALLPDFIEENLRLAWRLAARLFFKRPFEKFLFAPDDNSTDAQGEPVEAPHPVGEANSAQY